jgi:hypothetical protein
MPSVSLGCTGPNLGYRGLKNRKSRSPTRFTVYFGRSLGFSLLSLLIIMNVFWLNLSLTSIQRDIYRDETWQIFAGSFLQRKTIITSTVVSKRDRVREVVRFVIVKMSLFFT